MAARNSLNSIEQETCIDNALAALASGELTSIRAAADRFKVSKSTLQRRYTGGISRYIAHENQQILSKSEEKTLVRWIDRWSIAGSPITPSLLKELARKVREHRKRRASASDASIKTLPLVGRDWIYRFLNRYPTIKSVYARTMNNARVLKCLVRYTKAMV